MRWLDCLFFLAGVLENGLGFQGRVGMRTGDTGGQRGMDPIQWQAFVNAIGKAFTVNTLSAWALHQVANVEVEAISVFFCHGFKKS